MRYVCVPHVQPCFWVKLLWHGPIPITASITNGACMEYHSRIDGI